MNAASRLKLMPPATFTGDGYEICNAFYGRVLPDNKRYVNPKMENELKIFKKKITARFGNREIVDFSFPRFSSTSSTDLTLPPEEQ